MKPLHSNISLSDEQLNYQENPLWIRIINYAIDDASAVISFSKKIAQTEKWTEEFTKAAILEYKRFIYLCCVSKNGASPSVVVDKVWHMHLLYTTEYWKNFCPNILRRELHHFPNVGGIIDYNKHHDWYLETMILYLKVFKQNPPSRFWRIPKVLKPFLNTPSIHLPPMLCYLALVIPFVLNWLLFGKLQLSRLSVLQYHVLFIPLIIIITWVVSYSQGRHLQPLIRKLPGYNRYQLAYLSGGYHNAFLLLLNDLEEYNWIKLHYGAEDHDERHFALKEITSKASRNSNLINGDLLLRSLKTLPDPSHFNLTQLREAVNEYLSRIATVQHEHSKRDYVIFPVWMVLTVLLISCYPGEDPLVHIVVLDFVLAIITGSVMYAWIVRETDHDMIKRELKKYGLFFNGINTLNQCQIIMDQYPGVSNYFFFKNLGNFFVNKKSCGATPPPSCSCGC
jgi:hypothetical protein